MVTLLYATMDSSFASTSTTKSIKKPSLYKRKPNWNEEENLLLIQLVNERKRVIKGKFGPQITSAKKKEAWREIAFQINESCPRAETTADDCERNWYTVQSKARKELSEHNKQYRGTSKCS